MVDAGGDPDAMTSACGDVHVLDLSVYPGGALAAMHLGEYGARVTRAESRREVRAGTTRLVRFA